MALFCFPTILFTFFLTVFSFHAHAEEIFTPKWIFSLDYELRAFNYGEYSQSQALAESAGRDRTIEYKGDRKGMAGFSFELQPDQTENTKIFFRAKSTLLTGQENGNSNNLDNQADFDLDEENSHILSIAGFFKKWVLGFEYQKLSIGKVKLLDTSSDSTGNTGRILGTYNLIADKKIVSAYYRLGDFPFVMGLRGHQETLPRMPQTYRQTIFQGSGPLQSVEYKALKFSMELGEGEFLYDLNNGGFKWSLLFAVGLAEYDFVDYENQEENESSSTVLFRFAMGYQWNFMIEKKYFFLKWDNYYSVRSFDNNDSNAEGLRSIVHRTSGSDEEMSVSFRLGMRIK